VLKSVSDVHFSQHSTVLNYHQGDPSSVIKVLVCVWPRLRTADHKAQPWTRFASLSFILRCCYLRPGYVTLIEAPVLTGCEGCEMKVVSGSPEGSHGVRMADATAEFRSAGLPNTHQEIYRSTKLLVAYRYHMTCKVLATTFRWYLLI
jgi:hypothetical protein